MKRKQTRYMIIQQYTQGYRPVIQVNFTSNETAIEVNKPLRVGNELDIQPRKR